jgi:hypothetical protein
MATEPEIEMTDLLRSADQALPQQLDGHNSDTVPIIDHAAPMGRRTPESADTVTLGPQSPGMTVQFDDIPTHNRFL